MHAPVDVERILDEAVKRNTKELLVLTGERPEVNPIVAERLAAWGHEDFTSYVVWACERALERGMLPHTRLGRAQLKKLKVYAGPNHPHAAQQPQVLELERARARS